MNALVWSFPTKLSIYLWIKAGDRHYHFVEPWVIDRPFCRMETLYRSHFVEKGLVHYKMGHPNPTQGMEGGSLDIYTLLYPALVHPAQSVLRMPWWKLWCLDSIAFILWCVVTKKTAYDLCRVRVFHEPTLLQVQVHFFAIASRFQAAFTMNLVICQVSQTHGSQTQWLSHLGCRASNEHFLGTLLIQSWFYAPVI